MLKTRADVTPDKLRGGFYTPPGLVLHALTRLPWLLPPGRSFRVLEPAVGDGAFIDGLVTQKMPVSELIGIDIDPAAVAVARDKLRKYSFTGSILNESTLRWSLDATGAFDAVVGNLPFVRFQFISTLDRELSARHGEEVGISVAGVANLWLPMLLASVRHLKIGGAFSLILPAECLTGISARSVRRWLLSNTESLRCDFYPPGSFPGVLQEVIVLSGRRCPESPAKHRPLAVATHCKHYSAAGFDDGHAQIVQHHVAVDGGSWTHLFLTPHQVAALEEVSSLPAVQQLQGIARFEVAAVTGANSFFSLSQADVMRYRLEPWVRPLLARAKQAPGLVFSQRDYEQSVAEGSAGFLFDAKLAPVDRRSHRGVDRYLAEGEDGRIHERYKCRIRQPWYAVPYIKHATLLLSKRCHRFPRVIANETTAVTTDTIYRGRLLTERISEYDFVAGFHNSLTLLSAELEGRSFGGGVLELVPSEVGRLLTVAAPGLGEELGRLDRVCREAATLDRAGEACETLVRETDLLLIKSRVGLTTELLEVLGDARLILQERRLLRAAAPSS
jgi:adenine-specific DNA-methyltransferase